MFIEATAVTDQGRITNGDLGLWSSAHMPPLKRIADLRNKRLAEVTSELREVQTRKSDLEDQLRVVNDIRVPSFSMNDEPGKNTCAYFDVSFKSRSCTITHSMASIAACT